MPYIPCMKPQQIPGKFSQSWQNPVYLMALFTLVRRD